MLINLLKYRFNSFTGEKILQMGGRGVSAANPYELLIPPYPTSDDFAGDFPKQIFSSGTPCKEFASFPHRPRRHQRAEQYGHTQHHLAAPPDHTAGTDTGHAVARTHAEPASHDRAYAFQPSLADASRRFCFAQQVGAVKQLVLIDP